jgi:hypothetical protein
MKKLIVLICVLSIQLLAQSPNWTSLKETNLNTINAITFDLFSNGFGHHVIVQESNALKYYKMDANGNAGNAISIESAAVVSPSICGDNNRLYIVYRKSSESYIRTKFSSDGGSTWSYLASNPQNSNASSIESIFSNNKLHVTFDVSNTAYYAYYTPQNSVWSSLQTVSSSENGTTPRITAWYTSSQDRVVFMYKKTSTESRWREWNASSSSWVNNPQTAFTVSSSYSSDPKGIAVDANYIYSYYEFTVYNPYAIYSQLQQRLRSNNSLINTSIAQTELSVPKMFSTTTTDNISHTAFYYNGVLEGGYEIGIMRNKHTGSGISADPAYPYEFGYDQPTMINISSTSNDVFVVWKDGLSDYLNLVYDDQVPLAPQNLSVSVYTVSEAQYPKLTWNLNNEPDVRINEAGYLIERRTRIAQGSWSGWTQIGYSDGGSSTFIDYGITTAGDGFNDAEYRIRAKDMNDHTSEYSSIVQIEYGHQGMEKKNSESTVSIDYTLDQNYPNPFNPSTKISYSIKEEGLVTLKVYDILGKEIATLVNENKPAGNYEVEFNASLLPSGMYIYKIQSGQFSDAKKMILTK